MTATAAEPATSSQPACTTPAVPSVFPPSVEDEARAAAQATRAVEDGAVICAAMTRLAARTADAAWWPATDRRAVLAAMDRAIDGLGAARAAVLVAERASGAWEGDGDRSFEAWRGRTSNVGQRTATLQVRAAEQLDAVPAVSAAVTAGRIGLEHATIIARVAATGTPAQREAAQSPAGQAALLDLAGRVDAGIFATATARWAAEVDPARLEHDHQAQRAARYLNLTETDKGTYIKGLLDSYTGHTVALTLEAVTPRPGPDDERQPEQRRADALRTLAENILASVGTKPGAHVPPQVSLILTEETWLAVQAERDRQRADYAPDPPTVATTVVGYPPATLQDGTPGPVSELTAALCECELTRIVIDANGEPVDLGRTERLFTGAHRWAVIARDRECAWPDCDAHARWCHVQHRQWWERDLGATSVENGVLLCNFHHHEVHRRDLAITRHPIPERPRGPDAARPRGTMARVTYTFHEPNGRVIGLKPPGARAFARDDPGLAPAENHVARRSQPALVLT